MAVLEAMLRSKILLLFAVTVVFISCAMTPDFSGYTNSQLVHDYHKTLTDLRYSQQSYDPNRERSQPYSAQKVAILKERMSLLRSEILGRGLSLPQ